MAPLTPLNGPTINSICRSLADAVTHAQLDVLFEECGIEEPGRGHPRWQRMVVALSERQRRDRCGNNALAFIARVLHSCASPTDSRRSRRSVGESNFQLAFCGLSIDERGETPKRAAGPHDIGGAEAR